MEKELVFSLNSLEQYKNEFNKDVSVDFSNIKEKSMSISSIRAKWLMYYFKEKENLEKLKNKKKSVLENTLANKGCVPGTNLSLLKIKNQEKIENQSELLKKIITLENATKTCIEYIEYSMNILNDFGFQIKNSIEILKLETM